MKRSASGTHDLENENIATQKSSRVETVTDTCRDEPIDSWALTALPIKMVFSMRDIVQKVLAPLLDLETLFNLSRVNRRLRTLLHEDPSLEAAKGYKGTMADYPEFVVEHMTDLRVTDWMARRWKATFPIVVEFNGGVYAVNWDITHFLKNLIWPLLDKSKLPDEELSRHMDLMCAIIFPGGELSITRAYKSNAATLDHDDMFQNIARLACIRIQAPMAAMMLISAYIQTIKRTLNPGEIRILWSRALLISQVSGNANLSNAIVATHGSLQPEDNHPKMMVLFACASGKPDFFESEYIRFGKCVSIPELLVFAKICNRDGMVRYILDVHCTCNDIERASQFIHNISSEMAMLLMISAKLTNTAIFSATNYDIGIEPEDPFKFERHIMKLSKMFIDAHIRKTGGNQEDAEERTKVGNLLSWNRRNDRRRG